MGLAARIRVHAFNFLEFDLMYEVIGKYEPSYNGPSDYLCPPSKSVHENVDDDLQQ